MLNLTPEYVECITTAHLGASGALPSAFQPCMRTEGAAGLGANFDQGWICPELRPPTDRSSQFRYNSETELAIET